MKCIVFFFCFIFSFVVYVNNIIVNGICFIYSGNEKEIMVQFLNNVDCLVLVQVWLDNGDVDVILDIIIILFIIILLILCVDVKSGQMLCIKFGSSVGLVKDKEMLWWLNLLEILLVVVNQKNEGQNVLQLVICLCFKFIYCFVGLGNCDVVVEKLILIVSGSSFVINNLMLFYIIVSCIFCDGGKVLNSKIVMLVLQFSQMVVFFFVVNCGEILIVNNINDYGVDVVVKVVVK